MYMLVTFATMTAHAPIEGLRTVHLACWGCGQPVALTYRPGARFRTGAWKCPLAACAHTQTVDLPGSVVNVVTRTLGPTARVIH